MKRIDKRRLTVDVATKTLIRQLIGLGYGHSELAIVKRALAAMEFQEIVTIGLDTVRGAPPIVGGSVTHSHFQQQGQPR